MQSLWKNITFLRESNYETSIPEEYAEETEYQTELRKQIKENLEDKTH